MASLFNKLAKLAHSPQGRRAVAEAKRFANDPRRRQQALNTLQKLKNKGTGKKRPYRP